MIDKRFAKEFAQVAFEVLIWLLVLEVFIIFNIALIAGCLGWV